MDKFIELVGVGRKIVNVVRGEVWGFVDGIIVDIYVKRFINLIGFVDSEDLVKIELEFMKIVFKKFWIVFLYYLILYGRVICIVRRLRCLECEIFKYCNYGIKKLLE